MAHISAYQQTASATYDAGLLHPPPPPHPMASPPLPVKWVVVLFGLVAFPLFLGGLVWPRRLPPLWRGPVVFLVGPALPVGGSAFHRGMVWLRSNEVIVTCLVPSRLWGGACGRFGWPRPACVGQCVLQRYGMVAAAC